MDGSFDKSLDGWMDGWMGRLVDRCMDGLVGEWIMMDGWIERMDREDG